jgi:hypothetical protein
MALSETPIARLARWWVEERGMRCEECGAKLDYREQKFCSEEHAESFQLRTAI